MGNQKTILSPLELGKIISDISKNHPMKITIHDSETGNELNKIEIRDTGEVSGIIELLDLKKKTLVKNNGLLYIRRKMMQEYCVLHQAHEELKKLYNERSSSMV